MTIYKDGVSFVLGVVELKPILPKPRGTIRIRMRYDEIARCYIKTRQGIEEWDLNDCGDHWELGYKLGENKTV